MGIVSVNIELVLPVNMNVLMIVEFVFILIN